MKNKVQFIMINILLMGSCALSIVPKSDVIQKEKGLLLLAGDSDDDYFFAFMPFKKNNFNDLSGFLQEQNIYYINLTMSLNNCILYKIFDIGENIDFEHPRARISPVELSYHLKTKEEAARISWLLDLDKNNKEYYTINGIKKEFYSAYHSIEKFNIVDIIAID